MTRVKHLEHRKSTLPMEDPGVSVVLSHLQSVLLLGESQIAGERGVPLEQEQYKEKAKQLREAIQQGRLKSEPLSYWAMTINMNGKGAANNRRALLSIIIRDVVASVMFCQELPDRFTEIITDDCGFVKNEKEAAVIWRKDYFDGTDEGLKTTDSRIIKTRDDMKRSDSEVDVSELLSRVAMIKLTSRETETEKRPSAECRTFLAASWHGPHTKCRNEEQKNQVFRGLIRFLEKVCMMEGDIPFIVGGDFNFDTWGIEPPKDVVVPLVEMSPRDERREESSPTFIPRKDNFFYSRTKKLALSVEWSTSFDFTNTENLSEEDKSRVNAMEVQRGQATYVLDHDPVFTVLKLDPRSPSPVKNLTDEFEKLMTPQKTD